MCTRGEARSITNTVSYVTKPRRDLARTVHRSRRGTLRPRQDGRTLGETRAVLLAVAGGESSDPTPVRGDAAADPGPAGADGLTCSERHGVGLAKREHRQGEVSRKMLQNQVASGQFDLDVDPADGFESLKNGRWTNLVHAEGFGV